MQKLSSLWEHRKSQLETAERVIVFMEEVPLVLSWLDGRGAEYLRDRSNYGRSKEEVGVCVCVRACVCVRVCVYMCVHVCVHTCS